MAKPCGRNRELRSTHKQRWLWGNFRSQENKDDLIMGYFSRSSEIVAQTHRNCKEA